MSGKRPYNRIATDSNEAKIIEKACKKLMSETDMLSSPEEDAPVLKTGTDSGQDALKLDGPTPFESNCSKGSSFYHISGTFSSAKKELEGTVEEKGNGRDDICLDPLDVGSLNVKNGEVVIICHKEEEEQTCDQEEEQSRAKEGRNSDGDTGDDRELVKTSIEKEFSWEDDYPHKLLLSGYCIYYNSDVRLDDMQLNSSGGGLSFTATGTQWTVESLTLRLGGGGAALWISSGGKVGKFRIVPVKESDAEESQNIISWTRSKSFVRVLCH